MSTDFKVDIIHRETITPSSPTPPHLRSVDLSFLDQLTPELYVPLVLFYPNHADHEVDFDHQSLIAEKSNILKASLSETLTHFYPLAGKFQYNDSIFCDDRGAAFIEARVNFFQCGGMAIAINISHKLADAFTFSTFIKRWSVVALGSSSTADHPVLPAEFGVAASLYPPQDFLNAPKPLVEFSQGKCTTRRFVFDASRIAALKSKAVSASVPNPTRVEVVSALIWKCAIEASRSNLGSIRPSLWCQAMDMRKRSGQAFTKNLLGNFLWYFAAITVESEVDIQSLVATFRKCIEDYEVKYPNGPTVEDAYQTTKEFGNLLAKEGIDNYTCSSWCWFPFYEANFGWGKPSWVSIRSFQYKNTILLMDTKDGIGIEASLTFLEEDMAIVESNQELLAYASLNPSIV